MEMLSPYTQQLIQDSKKTGATAGTAGVTIPDDYASNPLERKIKEMRPGTKRKVLFSSLSFIFLLTGIIGIVVSWYYAYNPGPQSNQLLSLAMATELTWLSLASIITAILGPPPQIHWQVGEIFAWTATLALCLGVAICYGYQARADATGWMAACSAVAVVGLAGCIMGKKEGWFDPEQKEEGTFGKKAAKVSTITYRVIMGLLTIANFVFLGFLLNGGIQSAAASKTENPPLGRSVPVTDVGNVHVYCDGPLAGAIRSHYLLDVDFGANHFDMLGLLQSLALEGARVCVYDRPGYGFSDYPVNYPRTDQQIVREIRLITEAMVANPQLRLRKPFNYVGHRKGGQLMARYAEQYPQDVNAIAFLDSWPADAPYINSAVTGGKNWTREEIMADRDAQRRGLDANRGFYGPAGMLYSRFPGLPKTEPFVPAEFEEKRYASYMHDKTWASQYHEFRNNERSSYTPGPLPDSIRILSIPVQTTPADADNWYNQVMRNYTSLNMNALNRVVNCTDGCTSGFIYTRPTWLARQLVTYMPNI
ncbi:Alpha/Beta hydrolase protein [Hyaloraphidium curvatum]|nr:Alpha/Beta hydrolase protein [Hyaloraphidium curvatum]